MSQEILSRRPRRRTHDAPLLFVHGAFLGAWCWDEHFLSHFASLGYDAHAVSLRGHGASPLDGPLDVVRLDDYVADVLLAARRLGASPVLIGHSMGAIVVQRAARRCDARAMVLIAPVPPRGLGGSLMSLAIRDLPLFLALNAFQADGNRDAPALGRIRNYLFSDSLTQSAVRRYLERMQRESQRALMDLMWPQHLWIRDTRGLPTLVMGAGADALCSGPMIEEAARFHDVSPTIFEGMGHAMMLDPNWPEVAQHLGAWLDELPARL